MLPALMYHNFADGLTFSGATACAPNASPNSSSCLAGFECPGVDPSICFGHTGLQVLESIHAQFHNFSATDHYFRNLGISFGIVGMWVVLLGLFRAFSSRTRAEMALPKGGASVHMPPSQTRVPVDAVVADGSANVAKKGHLHALLDVRGGREGAVESYQLTMRGLSVKVESSAEEDSGKILLRSVDAVCDSGRTLAIMGPSGGGKTTLLDSLNGESGAPRGLCITGKITLNGIDLTPEVFHVRCAYIEQADSGLWPCLSASEQVTFAAACSHCEPDTATCVVQIADAILASTGLTACQHTRAGGDDGPLGLSGGQRRRLSLAIALAKKPAVLIADEPTSGLDSAAAAAIVMLLGELARDTHMAVVATIHQPSPAVFAGLDELLLLSKGCTVYAGAASNLAGYLGTIGKPLPSGISVAEHALDLVNPDFTSDVEVVDAIIEAWRLHGDQTADKPSVAILPMPTLSPKATPARQFGLLLPRLMVIAWRDSEYVRLRFLMIPALWPFTLFLSSKVRDHHQEGAFLVFNLCYTLILTSAITGMTSFLVYCNWVRWFRREIKTGMYGPIACSIALTLVVVLLSFLMVLISTLVAFVLFDFAFAALPVVWLVLALNVLAIEFWAILASFLGLTNGLPLVGAFVLHNFLSCGVFLSTHKIIWPFKLFVYILPWHRTFGAILYSVFHKSADWNGAVRSTGAETTEQSALVDTRGFYCPDQDSGSTIACYGITGDEVLESLHVRLHEHTHTHERTHTRTHTHTHTRTHTHTHAHIHIVVHSAPVLPSSLPAALHIPLVLCPRAPPTMPTSSKLPIHFDGCPNTRSDGCSNALMDALSSAGKIRCRRSALRVGREHWVAMPDCGGHPNSCGRWLPRRLTPTAGPGKRSEASVRYRVDCALECEMTGGGRHVGARVRVFSRSVALESKREQT